MFIPCFKNQCASYFSQISKCRTVLCRVLLELRKQCILINKATLMYASTHFTEYDGLCRTLDIGIELMCTW